MDWKFHWLKSLLGDIISAVDYFLEQKDPSTATLMGEMCGLQRSLYLKIKFFWSYYMRVSWSTYELFSEPSIFTDGFQVLSAVDDFFDQWDPSTETPMKEAYKLERGLCWKINLIWSAYPCMLMAPHNTKYSSLYSLKYCQNLWTNMTLMLPDTTRCANELLIIDSLVLLAIISIQPVTYYLERRWAPPNKLPHNMLGQRPFLVASTM